MEKKWFVVYTRPQQELKVASQLSAMGITNYCPTITLVKQYSDRKKKVTKPLLSSYVMVELEEKSGKSFCLYWNCTLSVFPWKTSGCSCF
jgi:transcription antitermination factor NusG